MDWVTGLPARIPSGYPHVLNCSLLHLAMCADNTADGLCAACTTDVKQWYMQNGLQLNPDKSAVLPMGTANQLQAVSSLTSVCVA